MTQLFFIDIRNDGDEFLAPPPADNVRRPEAVADRGRDQAQNFVAGIMAIAIVNIFELVDIDKKNPE